MRFTVLQTLHYAVFMIFGIVVTAQDQFDFAEAMEQVRADQASLVSLEKDLKELVKANLLSEIKDLKASLEHRLVLLSELKKIYNVGPQSREAVLELQIEQVSREFSRRVELLKFKKTLFMPLSLIEDIPAQNLVQPIEVKAQDLQALAGQTFEQEFIPLLEKHCYECHDSQSAKGDLDLEELVHVTPLVVNRKAWLNVLQQLRIRSMPPSQEPQPSNADRLAMAALLVEKIKNFDYSTVRQPGYEPAKRLTHEEYNHTIRDLLGIDLRPADQFPVDLTASSGFANSANSLFLQPVLLERYIGAAERVVDTALRGNTSRGWEHVLGGREPREALPFFALRAFRRPPSQSQTKELLQHFDQLVRLEDSPRGAFAGTVQVILSSPSFLIRTEATPNDDSKLFRIDDYELASRLSYFLWASMPDDELFDLAAKGELGNSSTLDVQVRRMLKDPKSQSLGSLFASQWLGFANLQRHKPDPIDNPWATDSLISAMKAESGMFFHRLIQNNEPVNRLIDANFTFLNEELAKHYRISGVNGSHMRLVSLKGTGRSGILGQGSVLAITSFPGRTSPVVRGNWILSELLGTPPPPPPPNASQFSERISENRRLSQRDKLKLHRNNPNCYVCHNQIDPLGFALEGFEWFGRKRRASTSAVTGQLPSGRKVIGLEGLRNAILEERFEDLLNQTVRKMLAYALGRQLEYYDEAVVREIIVDTQGDGGRLQEIIQSIVTSDSFQMKQLPKD